MTTLGKFTRLFLFFGIYFMLPDNIQAQTIYTMASVPEMVKEKADVVTHLKEYVYEVDNNENAKLSVHRVFTVLNEEGKSELFFRQYSSKYATLSDPEIKVFDANGKQKEKYKKKDMSTISYGEGLIDDGFLTYYPVTTNSYPVTIDVKYEIAYKGTFFIPDFDILEPKEGLIESSFTARVPASSGFRYKAINTTIQPEVKDDGYYKLYTWKVGNMAPIAREVGTAAGNSSFPHLEFAVNKFSLYGIPGDFTSWSTFGKWINELYTGLDALPADRQAYFKTLVKDAVTDREKARRIYNYLQQNFRYVSIQLGIGGYKPFSAEFTDQKKYGDCKALSNYMHAALKAVGIKSYVALINGAYNGEAVDPAFPANGFNHVILCIPQPKDSIWLECTSQTAEFAELGTFTENRNALLITDEGGALVPTPNSRSQANLFRTITKVNIDADNSGLSETLFSSKGDYNDLLSELMKQTRDHQKEILVSYLGFKHPDDFELEQKGNADDHQVELKMLIPKVPEFVSGTKWFFSPRIYKIWTSKMPKGDNRKLDFYFDAPFEKYDTTIYKLPEGAKTEIEARKKELHCDYASFNSSSWYNATENAVYSTSILILKQHKIPAAAYASVKKFFDAVLQEDAQRLIVVAPETAKKAF